MPASRRTRGKSGQALGLDIGSKVAKAILMEEKGPRLDICAAGSINLPDGMVEGGVVLDPQGLGKKIAAQLSSWNVAATTAIISIPSSLAVLRWIHLPPLEGEELRSAAKYKAKRHLPFSTDSAYIEASPVELSEDGQTGSSLVIATRREVVDSRAEAVEAAGLRPGIAELEAQSILRVVERHLN